MKGKTVIRAVSVLGFMAVAIVAASLGLKSADSNEQVADKTPVDANVELAPSGAISIPARKVSIDGIANTTAPIAPKTRGLSLQTSQRVSNKCRLPNGSVCNVRAKSVGSSCKCPGISTSGVIVN